MNLLEQKLACYTEPQRAQAAGIYPYFRKIESDQDTEVLIDGKKVLMFGSNAYLGLTNHPEVKAAAIAAVEKYGTGCAGSRFLNGTLDSHLELEKRLAAFAGKEDAIIFSTGFQVNLGVISCLLGREDYIIWDALDHASIIEGIRLSPAKSLRYKHNDMEALERRLKQCEDGKIKLIVVDGVFSMEGDLCKLPEIIKLAEKYGASVMVDEAHGFGVLGDHGRGVCNHFGLTDKVDLIMGTFSKSFASIGGFIAGSKTTINYIRHHARSYIFSASCTPAATAAASKALDIMLREPERVQALQEKTQYCLERFRSLGFEIGNTSTPIIPLFVRDNEKTFRVTAALFHEGVFVNPVVAPAVAPEDTLIRFSLMATHTYEQLDRAIDTLHKVFIELNIPLHAKA
ncbi:serine palmitoyltransferase [Porphyromonas catoniae]|mgnify:FL=1|jgi:8-amino-7-oxononanoate synthase|uniref:Serine palmitoyltransferase n=1 Tax=Porphyromonas catoniae ATCC 51270 TaxID=887901 RepID=Z4WT78_9PORP|nr:pyridoxal phosphate-dependent aminotransferase family protein [Porphyromonas catoniae]EWC92498.1 putative 8-amino-7-oxononanoate synthase [Porphyromonas catoniae ATCC 51270]